MTSPARIDPDSLYDDAALCLTLPISSVTLAKARKAGSLRFTRNAGRTMYFGRWILEWLESGDSGGEAAKDTRRELISA